MRTRALLVALTPHDRLYGCFSPHSDVRLDLYKSHEWLFTNLCALVNRLRDPRMSFLFVEPQEVFCPHTAFLFPHPARALLLCFPAPQERKGYPAASPSADGLDVGGSFFHELAESVLADVVDEPLQGRSLVCLLCGCVENCALRNHPSAGLPEEIELRGLAPLRGVYDGFPSPSSPEDTRYILTLSSSLILLSSSLLSSSPTLLLSLLLSPSPSTFSLLLSYPPTLLPSHHDMRTCWLPK